MAGWGAFVGREGELSRLQAALAGRARLVLVVGDAGIGKTRFVAEGLARAADTGMKSVSGGCLPLAEKLPLLPMAEALTELSRLDGGGPFDAALAAAPDYVRPELARLLPRLTAGESVSAEPAEGWRYERLFAGVAELLDGVSRRSRLGLLVEDVHWADTATLDFLTYVARAARGSAMSVVVTCRSDEVPLDTAVAEWLVHVRRDAAVEEIRLGPLSQSEVAEQISGLVGTAPSGGLVEEVYARAEGHPFFTEQLVAAGVTGSGRVALPARLAELLVARAGRCSADARVVLSALAVAGRPLIEDMLGTVTVLDPDAVRDAVRELTAARLLAEASDKGYRLRHALLAEAVAAELLPGEQISLHERVARALETGGEETLAAEAAGHWEAAGRTVEELRARLTAAEAAEHVFAYADAATHWQRAIELRQAEPEADLGTGMDVPHLYIRAVDALDASGQAVRAGAAAEEAYRRFADHPDRATAAAVNLRAAMYRGMDSPAARLLLMNEALRLFEGTGPSVEHARAWLRHANDLLLHSDGRHTAEGLAALKRALDAADAAGATTLTSRILCAIAYQLFLRGEVADAFGLLARARSVPEASGDAWAVLWLAGIESDALLKAGKLEAATEVGLRGFDAARQLGFGSSFGATIPLGNAVEGLLGRGRTTEAAALIDPLTTGPIERDNVLLHGCRAGIDLLRGEVDAAAQRLSQIKLGPGLDFAREFAQGVAEVALWNRRPDSALDEVQRMLERLADTDLVILCGRLLAVGMRACADLAERARARRDDRAIQAALGAADSLASWVDREHDAPFTEHPFVATIPADRATWNAERGRAVGVSDPDAWNDVAERWEALDYRHRAGYARWRQAEAILVTPHGGHGAAATVLSIAADLAQEHVPLTTAIHDLARRARIDLSDPADVVLHDEPAASGSGFGLTDRELDVLRLLAEGRTNPEIAAALFISPRTVGVHVSSILRKLDATTRVQAATVAEREGLLADQPRPPATT